MSFTRKVIVVILVIALVALLYAVRQVFVYTAFAVLISYLLWRPVEFLSNRRVPKMLAILLTFFVFGVIVLGLFVLIVPRLAEEVRDLARSVPQMMGTLETYISNLVSRYSEQEYTFTFKEFFSRYVQGQDFAGNVQKWIAYFFSFFTNVTSSVIGAFIIPIMSYYLLKDAPRIKRSFLMLFPQGRTQRLEAALAQINTSLGNYVRGQLYLCLTVAALVTLGLMILGVRYSFILGVWSGMTEFIPLAGPTIGMAPALLIAFLTDPMLGFRVLIMFIIVQLVENYVLWPRIMGHHMNLHPLTCLIGMMIGGTLAGIVGMLLALPTVAVVKTVLDIFVFKTKDMGMEFRDLISAPDEAVVAEGSAGGGDSPL
jgi:predicted PurR-regulated permease PerM